MCTGFVPHRRAVKSDSALFQELIAGPLFLMSQAFVVEPSLVAEPSLVVEPSSAARRARRRRGIGITPSAL